MKKARVVSYDVFRGVLLLAMVVFHVLVNLTEASFNQEHFYWVPLGFMMFLGVVLGRFLVGRARKKMWLALKLLGIFLAGNSLNFWSGAVGWRDLVVGNYEALSFEILLPMGVVILLAVLLDKIRANFGFLALLWALLVVFHYLGIHYYNLQFTIYGLIGYYIGRGVDLDKSLRNWFYLVPAGIFVVGTSLVVQYVGLYDFLVAAQVIAMYFVVGKVFGGNRVFVFLGKYSLILYVAHIVLIKLIS